MLIDVLGVAYEIIERSEEYDPNLKGVDGYCDWTTRTIVIERNVTGNLGNMTEYIHEVTRHEIVHAFLMESGLSECSGAVDAWALNEEMCDWFARMGPRIHAAWQAAGVA